MPTLLLMRLCQKMRIIRVSLLTSITSQSDCIQASSLISFLMRKLLFSLYLQNATAILCAISSPKQLNCVLPSSITSYLIILFPMCCGRNFYQLVAPASLVVINRPCRSLRVQARQDQSHFVPPFARQFSFALQPTIFRCLQRSYPASPFDHHGQVP